MLPQESGGGERLERRDVAGAGEDDVGLAAARCSPTSQIPIPRAQCAIASSIVSQLSAGCLPATMTLT